MHPREESTAVEFDVDIAIKVLRQSGYPDLAASLAEKHAGNSGGHLHQCFLEIQLEGKKRVDSCQFLVLE